MSDLSGLPKSWHQYGQKRHLVSVVLDGDQQIVVSKFWRSSKQCWGYSADPRWIIELEIQRQATARKRSRGILA